jgi:hypothetical protein
MSVVNIETESVRYDALSYVWGSQDQLFPIFCNGQLHHAHYNLYMALPYLARRTTTEPPLPIWIDALCINQGNEQEKRIQIASMNSIYRQAQKVWVWFGLAEQQNSMEEAVTLLHDLSKAYPVQENWWGHVETDLDPCLLVMQNATPETWQAVLHIIANPWYSRVWIVQEFVLAQQVTFLCGGVVISAPLLEAAVQQLFILRRVLTTKDFQPLAHAALRIFQYRQRCQIKREPQTLVSAWLLSFMSDSMRRGQHCFEPQDRVLGILGILRPEEVASLGVDLYTYTSIAELYTKFCSSILIAGLSNITPQLEAQFWEYMIQACIRGTTTDLPSWAVDLRYAASWHQPLTSVPNNPDLYKASTRTCLLRRGERSSELIFKGQIIDTISSVCDSTPTDTLLHALNPSPGLDLVQYAPELLDWESKVRESLLPIVQVDSRDSSHRPYWHTLLGGQKRDQHGDLSDEIYNAFRVTLEELETSLNHCKTRLAASSHWSLSVKTLTCLCSSNPDSTSTDLESSYAAAIAISETLAAGTTDAGRFFRMLSILHSRQLFSTSSGRIGFTFQGVAPGDLLCVLNGAITPHVLRTVHDSERVEYKLIGDAYVNGLMNGEVDRLDLKEQDIVLI